MLAFPKFVLSLVVSTLAHTKCDFYFHLGGTLA
jgi:hypothetical protein